MSRMDSTANNAVTAQPHVPYCVFVDLAFDSANVRVCSGYRSYIFDDAEGSNTYSGLGEFGAIDQVKESASLVPDKLQLTLSGVDNGLLTSTLAENYHGRSATIYVGYLNSNGDLVDAPYLCWEGRMDVMTIKTDVNSSTISLVCENRLVLWNRSQGWLYTTEHQSTLMGIIDNFFDLLPVFQNRTLGWANFKVASTPPPSSPQYLGHS